MDEGKDPVCFEKDVPCLCSINAHTAGFFDFSLDLQLGTAARTAIAFILSSANMSK